jgi:hypothetical protein
MIEAVEFFRRFFAKHSEEVIVTFDHVSGIAYRIRINDNQRTEKYFMQASVTEDDKNEYWSTWYLEKGRLNVYKIAQRGSLGKQKTYIHVNKRY